MKKPVQFHPKNLFHLSNDSHQRMKKFLFIALISIFCLSANAQQFPSLTGATLEPKTVTLPQGAQGKFTILGLVYSAKAQQVLGPWIENIYSYFMTDPDYDLNVYFVPMIGGLNGVAAGTIEKEMRKGIQPELHKHVLIYKGDLGAYKKTLGMEQKEIPYIFVLNKEGKIIYKTSGAYTDKKLEEMDELVDESADE